MVNDYNTKEPSLPWLVMYSNSGDIGILDVLAVKQAECATTGIVDFFVPLEVTRLAIEGRSVAHKRLIAGNYIFIRATREDILRLRQEPPFDAAPRFLHPSSSPTGCIYVPPVFRVSLPQKLNYHKNQAVAIPKVANMSDPR